MAIWTEQFASWYGSPFPSDYLVFDIETTGFNKQFDLPIDIGWCIVRGCEPVHRGRLVLDWTRYPELVDPDWLRGQLHRIGVAMASKGDTWVYTPEYLAKHGKDPLWVLRRVQQMFFTNRDAEASLAGHNAWNYDCPLMENVFLEYLGHLGDSFVFGDNEVYDTGGMEKAVQAGLSPYPDEKTLREYFARVHYSKHPGLKWNLHACAERYGLMSHPDIDPEKFHQAETDAFVSHLIFEEVRRCRELST